MSPITKKIRVREFWPLDPFFLRGEFSNFEGVDLHYIKNQPSRTSMCDTSLERSQLGEHILQKNVYPKMNVYPSRVIFIPSEGYIYMDLSKCFLHDFFLVLIDYYTWRGWFGSQHTKRLGSRVSDWRTLPFLGVKSAYFTGYSYGT